MTIAPSNPARTCVPVYGPRPSIFTHLMNWASTSRQRRSLGKLDSHILNDIGLTNAEAIGEAERAPWDVPQHWRC